MAADNPCKPREKIKKFSEGANPHNKELKANKTIPQVNTFTRP